MGYHYKAYTPDRIIVQGTIEAASESAAEDALYQAGYEQVLSLKEFRQRQTLRSQIPFIFGVKTPDLIDFARQLASLGMTPLVGLLIYKIGGLEGWQVAWLLVFVTGMTASGFFFRIVALHSYVSLCGTHALSPASNASEGMG